MLGQFVLALNRFCKSQHGLDHAVSDYHVYEFAKASFLGCWAVLGRAVLGAAQDPGPRDGACCPQIWGCDQARSNTIVHEFFKSPEFVDGIPVVPGERAAWAADGQAQHGTKGRPGTAGGARACPW